MRESENTRAVGRACRTTPTRALLVLIITTPAPFALASAIHASEKLGIGHVRLHVLEAPLIYHTRFNFEEKRQRYRFCRGREGGSSNVFLVGDNRSEHKEDFCRFLKLNL